MRVCVCDVPESSIPSIRVHLCRPKSDGEPFPISHPVAGGWGFWYSSALFAALGGSGLPARRFPSARCLILIRPEGGDTIRCG